MILFGFVSADRTDVVISSRKIFPGAAWSSDILRRFFRFIINIICFVRQLISSALVTLNPRRMWRPKPSLVDNQEAQCSFTPLSLARWQAMIDSKIQIIAIISFRLLFLLLNSVIIAIIGYFLVYYRASFRSALPLIERGGTFYRKTKLCKNKRHVALNTFCQSYLKR